MKSRLILPVLLLALPLVAFGFWQLFRDDGGREQTPGGLEQPSARESAAAAQSGDSLLGELLDGGDLLSSEAGLSSTGRQAEQGTTNGEQLDPSAASANMRVRGFIYDPLGKPVSGAEVRGGVDRQAAWFGQVADDLGEPVFSASDGSFTLTGKRAGPFRLRVSAAGFAPFERRAVSLPRSSRFEVADVLLDWGVILEGVVLNPDLIPVADAEIFSRIPSSQPLGRPELQRVGVTDDSGSFFIDRLGVGDWTLVVATDDFPDAVREGQSTRAQGRETGLEIILGRPASISGLVLGIPSGGGDVLIVAARRADAKNPWAKPQRQVPIEANGSFDLMGLSAGESYGLAVYPYAEREAHFFSTPLSEPLTALAGQSDVELNFITGGTLLCRVVDEATKLPISGLLVKAGFGWPVVLRDEQRQPIKNFPDGKVRYDGLRPNMGNLDCQLQISSVGYRDYNKTNIRLGVGEELDLGTIELSAIPVVRVNVVDSRDGTPLGGARVLMRRESSGGGATRELEHMGDGFVERRHGGDQIQGDTDAKGLAVLSSFENQIVSIRVNVEGFAPAVVRNLHLPLRRDLEQTISLGQGGVVHVDVRDDTGAPVGGLNVSQRRLGEDDLDLAWKNVPERSLVTDEAGRASFTHLQPGTQRFRLKSERRTPSSWLPEVSASGGEGTASVVVSEGGEHPVLLLSPALCALEGRLTEAGKPLSAASVELLALRKEEPASQGVLGLQHLGERSDSQGAYRLEGLSPGEYNLIIKHPQRSMEAIYPVTIVAGENRAHIDLSVSVIEGRVVTSEGDPIEGVRVAAQRADGAGGHGTNSFIMFGGAGGMFSVGGDPTTDTLSASDGSYRLRGVADGVELVLTAEGSMVQSLRSETFVLNRDELRISDDLVLQLAGSVRFELLVNGKPAPISQLTATQGGGDLEAQERDRTSQLVQGGKGVLSGLRPGIWRLSASTLAINGGGGLSSAEVEVEVRAGEEHFQTLHLDVKD